MNSEIAVRYGTEIVRKYFDSEGWIGCHYKPGTSWLPPEIEKCDDPETLQLIKGEVVILHPALKVTFEEYKEALILHEKLHSLNEVLNKATIYENGLLEYEKAFLDDVDYDPFAAPEDLICLLATENAADEKIKEFAYFMMSKKFRREEANFVRSH